MTLPIKTIQRSDVQVLQSFVDNMVGIPKYSYPARQNGAPKPEGDFAHIRLLTEYPVGIPHQGVKSQTDSETTFITRSCTRLRFRVGVNDTNGIASSKILHGWTSEAMKALMIETGYGFIRCHPITTETALLEKEWETRQGYSIELYTTRVYEETVDNITNMVINGEFIEGNESYLSTITINP